MAPYLPWLIHFRLMTSLVGAKCRSGMEARSTAMTTTRTASSGAAPGPDARVKITEGYARMVARDAYFWAWPMVNIYNRRLAFSKCPEPCLMNGVLPFAPLNALAMLHDYIQ